MFFELVNGCAPVGSESSLGSSALVVVHSSTGVLWEK